MKTLILSHDDVERMLTMPECIAAMEDALKALAHGEVHQPLRHLVRAEGAAGFLGLMPAYRGGARPAYGLKEVCVFPGNPLLGLDTHLGAVLLHDGETGELRAVINASAITAIRTAAVSAVATGALARANAKSLAIIGAGVQARTHLAAIPLVRDVDDIRIASRTRAKAEAISGATVYDSVEEAVRGADIIVTVTSSREPVLRREWIADGAHINAVGSSVAVARELDAATVAAAALYVDRRESTINESGDYLGALNEGAIARRVAAREGGGAAVRFRDHVVQIARARCGGSRGGAISVRQSRGGRRRNVDRFLIGIRVWGRGLAPVRA